MKRLGYFLQVASSMPSSGVSSAREASFPGQHQREGLLPSEEIMNIARRTSGAALLKAMPPGAASPPQIHTL